MSNVTLTIAGRHYTIACDPGEEEHVSGLGRMIDGKLAAMPGVAGQSEPRALLYAALLLADELHEARRGVVPIADSGCAEAEALAERLEAMAARLETGRRNA